MRLKIIACEVMKEELLAVPLLHPTEFHFVPMGYHLYPEKLHMELQTVIAESACYDRVILAFGLCGGAARNLQVTDGILTIPRVHDCIPVLLGSEAEFKRQQDQEKGTFYLSCGWFKSEKTILEEYKRLEEKYGDEKARKLMARIYSSYRRILFIHTGHPDEPVNFRKSLRTADLLQLEHHETEGSPGYMKRIVNGPWDHRDFINIKPGGILLEEDFLNCMGSNQTV